MSFLADIRNLFVTGLFWGLSLLFVGLYLREIELSENDQSAGVPIGKIMEAGQRVTRKPAKKLIWIPLSAPKDVYERDTIRTGPDSSVKIMLGKSTFIELRPESVAYLENDANGLRINLASGDLFAKGKVTAKIGGSEIHTKDGSFSASRDQNSEKILVSALEGKILARAQDSSELQLLSSGETLSGGGTEKSEIEKPLFKALTPKTGAVLNLPDKNTPVAFKLQSDRVSQNSLPDYVIQISKDRKFKSFTNQQLSANEGQFEATTHLEDGNYYWRIFNLSRARVSSNVESFEVSVPPELHWQFDQGNSNFKASLSSDGISTRIQWSSNKSSLIYRLKLMSSSRETLAILDTGSSQKIIWNNEQSKFFKVLRERGLQDDAIDLELIALNSKREVVFKEPLKAILELTDDRRPPAPLQLRAEIDPANPLKAYLKWNAPQISLARFEINLGSKTLTSDSPTFSLPSAELYELARKSEKITVNSINEKNLRSQKALLLYNPDLYSLPALLKKPSNLIYPPADRIFSRQASSVLNFTWEPLGNKVYPPVAYELLLASTQGDAHWTFKSSKSTYRLTIKIPNGRYQWKVRAVWPQSKEVAEWSPPRNFELSGFKLDAPVLRIPTTSP